MRNFLARVYLLAILKTLGVNYDKNGFRFFLVSSLFSQSVIAEPSTPVDLVELPSAFSPNNVSFHIREGHPFELSENFIFPDQVEDLSENLTYIKNGFMKKFSIDAQIEVSLVAVENGGDHDPIGLYSFHKISFGKLSKSQFEQLDAYHQPPPREIPNNTSL